MIWYLVLTESIILSRPRKVLEISDEVKSGAIAYALGRPYSYVLFHYFRFLGETAARLPINLIVGGAIASVMVGPIRASLVSLPAVALAVVGAISIDFFLSMAIGLLAFWVEDTTAFFWIYEKMLFTIGGMLVPLEICPPLLQQVSRALPFNLVVYGPARLLVDFGGSAFAGLMLRQLGWGAAMLLLAHLVFRLGAKRVSIHGG
jgi:ABC-2 type transport system permease protein